MNPFTTVESTTTDVARTVSPTRPRNPSPLDANRPTTRASSTGRLQRAPEPVEEDRERRRGPCSEPGKRRARRRDNANLAPVRKYIRGGLRLVEDTERNKGVFFQKGISPEVRMLFAACIDAERSPVHGVDREEARAETKEERREERVEFSPLIDGSLRRFGSLDRRLQKAVLRGLSIPPMAQFLGSFDMLLREYVEVGDEGLLLDEVLDAQVARLAVQRGSGNLMVSFVTESSYQRLMVHSLCKYYGLKSKSSSGDSSGGLKTIVITKHGSEVEVGLEGLGSLPVSLPQLLQVPLEELRDQLQEEGGEDLTEFVDVSQIELK